DLFILRGIPAHIRSDNGPEFVAKAVQEWIAVVGAKTAYIERGSPWENGYIESFNARLRDELLNGEIFYTVREAQIVIESWRRHYNTIRPHASIGSKPPAPEVFVSAFAAHSTWTTQRRLINLLLRAFPTFCAVVHSCWGMIGRDEWNFRSAGMGGRRGPLSESCTFISYDERLLVPIFCRSRSEDFWLRCRLRVKSSRICSSFGAQT